MWGRKKRAVQPEDILPHPNFGSSVPSGTRPPDTPKSAVRWKNITNGEFFAYAEIPEVQARANKYHRAYSRDYDAKHLLIHSCPCMHQAVDDYLNLKGYETQA
jgi:hypothetical protein